MLQNLKTAGLSELDRIGTPMTIGTTLDESGGGVVTTRRLLTVPPGQCFIMTSASGFGVQVLAGVAEVSPPLASRAGLGITFRNAAGTDVGGVRAMSFWRWQNLFNGSAANTWRNAHPGEAWTIKFDTPVCVPSGWHLNNTQPASVGNGSMARGYLVDERSAATMGFDTNTSSTTRRSGVASGIVTGSSAPLIAARAGQSIQILDLFVRVQPLATGAANVLTIEQSDNKDIFRFVNDNPANLAEAHLSPGLFLKPGTGLQIFGTALGTASVTVNYRYVDEEDVPKNHWWSCIDPTKPGTGATLLAPTIYQANTALAAYYPGKDITVASALAGPANQNVLQGYVTTCGRNSTASELVYHRLSTGAAGGLIGQSAFALVNTGTPVTPVQSAYSHEQTQWLHESGISVKTKTNEGFFFDALGGLIGSADASIRNWSCTAWGLTVTAVDAVGTRVRGTAT